MFQVVLNPVCHAGALNPRKGHLKRVDASLFVLGEALGYTQGAAEHHFQFLLPEGSWDQREYAADELKHVADTLSYVPCGIWFINKKVTQPSRDDVCNRLRTLLG